MVRDWEIKREDYIKREIEEDIRIRSRTPEELKRNKKIFRSNTFRRFYRCLHRKIVARAINEGRHIPPEVMEDYPEFKGKTHIDMRGWMHCDGY